MRRNVEFSEKEIGTILVGGTVGLFIVWNILFKAMQIIFI